MSAQVFTTRAKVVATLAAFALGFALRGCLTPGAPPARHIASNDGRETAQVWTCSMHPHIQLPAPGTCPICFMDLIPVTSEASRSAGLRRVSMSPEAASLLRIETSTVERRSITLDVAMIGMVGMDETRVATIASRVAGRIDQMYVDATGVPITKGQQLFALYSPELLAAQQELLQATRSMAVRESRPEALEDVRRMAGAVRDKLRLLGMTREQIAEIESRGIPRDHLTVLSPLSGIVTARETVEGTYVDAGMPVYRIADLSVVWLILEAYESDLSWLQVGQSVEATVEAYPGEMFRGTVSLIDPVLNEATRTAGVRVIVPNPALRLKPGMLVRGRVQARIATEAGAAAEPASAARWTCPMHPAIIAEEAGACPLCKMPLERMPAPKAAGDDMDHLEAPLVIPSTAPLFTGERAIVYVEVPGGDAPTYEGREVSLGLRIGDFVVIREGLRAGERVVTRGAFKLDAELQIRAQPSMMKPEGGRPADHDHAPPRSPHDQGAD